jgi:hypothetical protein
MAGGGCKQTAGSELRVLIAQGAYYHTFGTDGSGGHWAFLLLGRFLLRNTKLFVGIGAVVVVVIVISMVLVSLEGGLSGRDKKSATKGLTESSSSWSR